MHLYGLKNCDTCRKAVKALLAAGHEAVLVDVRAEALDGATLKAFQDAFGAALLNTRSATWRGLSEAERQADPLELLQAHPALMKRPVIRDAKGALHLGWGKDVQAALT